MKTGQTEIETFKPRASFRERKKFEKLLCTGQFQNRPFPPRVNPWACDFFEKFWSNSPLRCQFRRSNAPPVRASKSVKSPTLQACEANCGNKFCKIFSYYEFLVQLVFAPYFKQRHIPRQNYIKRQHQKNPRGIGKSNDS